MVAKRKTRMDKGEVKRTQRVLKVVPWVIEMDVVSIPQLQRLLARYPDTASALRTTSPTSLSLVRTLNIVRKWVDKGWVVYENPYRDRSKPGFIYATRKALKEFDYVHLPFRVRDYSALDHLFAVNEARLWCEAWAASQRYLFSWKSERILRLREEKNYPDGIFYYTSEEGAYRIAIEVETSRKSKATYAQIRGFYKLAGYNDVWYFHSPELLGVLEESFGDSVRYKSLGTLYLEDVAI